MKNIIKLFILIQISLFSYSQQIKTYSGNYDLSSYDVSLLGDVNPGLLDGKATYTYYEDNDLKRVRSGNFNYTGSINRNGVSLTVSIIGNYSKNKKNGNWIIKQTLIYQGTSANLSFNGNYKDGLPNGLWTSTLSATQKGKTVSGTYSLNFINNVISGEFKKITNDGTNSSVIGSFDKNGYFTGKTIVKKDGDEYQFTFNNGLLVSTIGRNLQSGNVFENTKINDEELTIFNNLMIEKDPSKIEESEYKIIDGYNNKLDQLLIGEFIEQMKNSSLFNLTPGDLSIDANKKYTWIGFKIRKLEKK